MTLSKRTLAIHALLWGLVLAGIVTFVILIAGDAGAGGPDTTEAMTADLAYQTALAEAQWSGLKGDPDNYHAYRMRYRQYATTAGWTLKEGTTLDPNRDVWVVAFEGDIDLILPGVEPGDDFDYIVIAIDAVTGETLATSSRFAGQPRPFATDD